jgi:hypothetical protein
MHICMYACISVCVSSLREGTKSLDPEILLQYKHTKDTAILIIIKGQFQVFQRFSSSKLVLETVESCFVALNYYENGSTRI